MATIVTRDNFGWEVVKAKTFGVEDAGSLISEEGETYFDDPNVVEIVIKKD